MWKIFFNYKDKSRCTVQGKGTITPELAVKCYYRYGLHAAESIYQQYPKKDHAPVPLEDARVRCRCNRNEDCSTARKSAVGQYAGEGE